MRRKNIFLGLLVLTLLSGLALSGCDDLFTNEVTFKNDSSYKVTVSMDGDDFTLETGKSKSVKYKGSSVKFLYSPANLVKAEQNGDTVTFKNI